MQIGVNVGLTARRPRGLIDYVTRWGVVAQWRFNGDGQDSVGTNHLTLVNSPTFVAGKVGSALNLSAGSTQYASVADNAALSTGDVDFWVAGWVSLTSKPAFFGGIVCKDDTPTAGKREYQVLWNHTTDRFNWTVFAASGSGIGVAVASTFGAPSLATWHFVVGYHDSVNNLLGISVDGGLFDTVATTGTPADGTSALVFGSDVGARYLDGREDVWLLGKSPPGGIAGRINEIRDTLYAAGAGREVLS